MIEFHKPWMTEKVKEEKSISGYIFKALKEIPMVVISIIIALQLDNWNEQRHLRHEEHQILNDMMVELREDSLQLVNVLDAQAGKSGNLEEVIQLLKSQNYSQFNRIDSLYSHSISSNPTFFPARGVYEAVSSSGKLELISDDLLKYRIANLYERYYTRLIYNGELYDRWAAEVDWNQREFVDKSRLRIRNPEALKSLEFHSNVEYLHNQNVFYTNLADEIMEQLQMTITHLEEYINN